MYHTSDSVDLKDLCVIWGNNITDDNFHKFSFWSDPWTCWYRTEDRQALEDFYGNQLSNNHLISNNDRALETIRNAHIGDQIHLKGMLVNYSDASNPGWTRETSTVRTDTGNGACEVVFVDQIKILKAANTGWWQVRNLSRLVLWITGIGLPLFWLLSIYLEQTRRRT
jgi:hypothetical protein